MRRIHIVNTEAKVLKAFRTANESGQAPRLGKIAALH
jgi:hypothetical protein